MGSADYGGLGASAADAGVGCLSSNECPTGMVCNDFGVCEAPPAMGSGSGSSAPPETEVDLGSPISAQRYVYVPMTAENELARIDGQTLAVTATPVGPAPRDAATIHGSDGAVVLDAQNGTATIVRPGVPQDTVKVLGTLQHLNRIDIDPTGHYAVLWFDLVKAIANGGLTGIGSFQDVTVISLDQGHEQAVNLTVGFRPRAVQFDAAGTRGYVVTQDGVSVIDLAVATHNLATIVPPIPVADPSIPVDDLEVQIVPSGNYAAVRQAGVSALRIVSIGSANPGQVWTLPMSSPLTDLDLFGSRLYAMERDAKKLAVVDVPAMTVRHVDLSDGAVGSIQLSADGTKALTFTNATLDPRITAVDLATFAHTTWPLKKGVRAVLMSPSSTSALVVNSKEPGDPDTAGSVEEYIARSYGYTVLDLATGFGKLQLTPVDATSFAYSTDGSKAYVALDGGDAITATRALQVVTIVTGVVSTKQLGSPPSSVGVLPGIGTAFTAQRHPLGRISFVDVATDAMRTVTGFDLNSHVVN